MIGDGYVLIADLTDEYIAELAARAGCTNVTPEESYWPYVFEDSDGNQIPAGTIQQARDWLITKYLIQQNS